MNFEFITKKIKSITSANTTTCHVCKKDTKNSVLENNDYICPHCKSYMKMTAISRIIYTLDEFEILSDEPSNYNPIDFPKYSEKQEDMRKKTGIFEAVLSAVGTINGKKIVVCAMDANYFMGSMGSYVGSEITNAFKYATKNSLPIVVFCASGGARMQEGIFSLMQMAKTTIAVNEHNEKNLLYISCMTNPTTGGVLASFSSIADIIIAEPHSHIGFAGPRVIKQTIKQELPIGFQSSEFLLEHGFLDDIVKREDLKEYIYNLIVFHEHSKDVHKVS